MRLPALAPEAAVQSGPPSEVRLVAHTTEPLPPPLDAAFGPDAALQDQIEFAGMNNPEIQAASLQARALLARVPQARALDDPTLMNTIFLEPVQTAAGPQDLIMSLQQKLPWFGKRELRGEAAYYDAQAAFARAAAVELNVVEQVKLAYSDLYFLERAIEVNRDLQARLEEIIEITRSRFEVAAQEIGLESVYQAQVELLRLQTALVEFQQEQQRALARLAEALSLPPSVRLDVRPSIDGERLPRSADVLVAMIDRCQPNLEALRRELNRDRASIALAERNYYPDLTLGFNWHAMGPTGLSRVATGEDSFALMVGFNLPVYQQKYDAALQEARFEAARTTQRYEATWDEVRAEVQTLYAQAVEHDRIVQILAQDILPLSRQTFDLSLEAFAVNRIGFQQLIDTYEDLLVFRTDYYRRLARREQALASLERAVGCAITTWPVELEEVPAVELP
ncbi:MAG: TolC family protein [Planctomycetes bacterium]|nr:TolC family protein [Planctomycetota bacterium]